MLAKNIINENSIDQLNTELSKYNKVFIITQQSIIDICKVKELVKHDNLFYRGTSLAAVVDFLK